MTGDSEPPAGARRNRVRVAVAAVAVLAIALVGGVVALGGPSRLSGLFRTSSAAKPLESSSSASPLPPTLVGPIPAGQPVILYRRHGDRTQQLIGASWTGLLYSGPDAPVGQGADRQSPDGSKILVGLVVYVLATHSQTRLLVDPNAGFTQITWGDDSYHLCVTQETGPAGSSVSISIMDVGSPAVHLATLGKVEQQVKGPTVLACSPLSDRVVIAQVGGLGETTELWVLNARTGAIEYHRTYPATTKTNGNGYLVVASRDGQYLAETATATATVAIRRLADDSVVTRLAGEEIHAFSWRGDLVVVTPREPNLAADNTTFQSPAITDWQTGQTVWESPQGARFFGAILSQPEGDGIALGLNFCAQATTCRENLWLVNRDGKRGELDHDVQVLWSGF